MRAGERENIRKHVLVERNRWPSKRTWSNVESLERPLYFFWFPLWKMDAETMKAGECLETQEFEAVKCSGKKVSEDEACRWRAINRPSRGPEVGRNEK